MIILKKGFFISNKPVVYIDTTSSYSTKSELYDCYYFDDNNFFVKQKVQNSSLNFFVEVAIEIIEQFRENPVNLGPAKVGNYSEEGQQIFIRYIFNNKIFNNVFTLLSPSTFIDENLLEYKFVSNIINNSLCEQ